MKKIVVAQGGGPTAVINRTLVGLLAGAREQSVQHIWGALHGIDGIRDSRFYDLTSLSEDAMVRLGMQAGAFLGSTRDKPDASYRQRLLESLRRHAVDGFFYIGGNDTARTLMLLHETAQEQGYDLRCFHVPKTIDNDLVCSDHTPGYLSAARFVAYAFRGLDLDQRALPGVHIGVVMGRHAGFLTAAAALARYTATAGPHLICLPEEPLQQEAFLSRISDVYRQHGRCLIACAEGVCDESGIAFAQKLVGDKVEKDRHGNVQLSGSGALGDKLSGLIKKALGIKRVRADTLGYLQRSFPLCLASRDAQEAYDIGVFALQQAQNHQSGSIAIQRHDDGTSVYALVQICRMLAGKHVICHRLIGNRVVLMSAMRF